MAVWIELVYQRAREISLDHTGTKTVSAVSVWFGFVMWDNQKELREHTSGKVTAREQF